MEKTIYKGVEGVFIPIDEFKYIKEVINNNKLLFQELAKEIAKDNPNAFDF